MLPSEKAREHAAIADQLLAQIKIEEMDVKDANNAVVANAHATLALFHQREAERSA